MQGTFEEPPSPEGADPEPTPRTVGRRLSRRSVISGLIAAGAAMALFSGLAMSADASMADAGPSISAGGTAAPKPDAKGFGSVSTAPGLSADFRKTFTSHFVQAGGLRQHAVIGGEGPPLLLVHGWPQNWYAWRLLMPALARDFTVVAIDQRGIGLTEKPRSGYDPGTLAKDLAALMDALGHERFSVVGTDTGMAIGYALAADHPQRVQRLALAEVPGLPGVAAPPPLFALEPLNNKLWHIPFNRVDNRLTEQLVAGHEAAYFGYEFAVQGGNLPKGALDYYVRLLSDPESLRGSFGFYRAWDAMVAQNEKRAKAKLTMPVLGIGGQESWGKAVADSLKAAAVDVRTAVIPGAAHWFAEQAPEATLKALTEFLKHGQGTTATAPAARRQ